MSMNVIEGGFAKKGDNVASIGAADNAAAIKFLEEALALAKSNKSVIALVMLVNGDDSISSGWSAADVLRRPFTVVGGLEAMKMDYMRMNVEQR